eukprot:m.100920 g.100920  ORF g.100920 m.100920 type:complete len:508 (+) comp13729_c0_seq4:334-1857(+)
MIIKRTFVLVLAICASSHGFQVCPWQEVKSMRIMRGCYNCKATEECFAIGIVSSFRMCSDICSKTPGCFAFAIHGDGVRSIFNHIAHHLCLGLRGDREQIIGKFNMSADNQQPKPLKWMNDAKELELYGDPRLPQCDSPTYTPFQCCNGKLKIEEPETLNTWNSCGGPHVSIREEPPEIPMDWIGLDCSNVPYTESFLASFLSKQVKALKIKCEKGALGIAHMNNMHTAGLKDRARIIHAMSNFQRHFCLTLSIPGPEHSLHDEHMNTWKPDPSWTWDRYFDMRWADSGKHISEGPEKDKERICINKLDKNRYIKALWLASHGIQFDFDEGEDIYRLMKKLGPVLNVWDNQMVMSPSELVKQVTDRLSAKLGSKEFVSIHLRNRNCKKYIANWKFSEYLGCYRNQSKVRPLGSLGGKNLTLLLFTDALDNNRKKLLDTARADGWNIVDAENLVAELIGGEKDPMLAAAVVEYLNLVSSQHVEFAGTPAGGNFCATCEMPSLGSRGFY